MDKGVRLLENDTTVKTQAPDLNERFSDFDISFGKYI